VQLLDIAEVARRSGIPASTLRFYEEKGLIASVGRRGQRRLFEPAVVERLALILLGQAAGFTLAEIAATFFAEGRAGIDRDRLVAKAEELERKMLRLTAIAESLRHAASCPALSHFECPSFRRLLVLAGSGRLEPLSPSPSDRRRPPQRG
jgi:MerR family redox-sensitive transcriptional activator SoxR